MTRYSPPSASRLRSSHRPETGCVPTARLPNSPQSSASPPAHSGLPPPPAPALNPTWPAPAPLPDSPSSCPRSSTSSAFCASSCIGPSLKSPRRHSPVRPWHSKKWRGPRPRRKPRPYSRALSPLAPASSPGAATRIPLGYSSHPARGGSQSLPRPANETASAPARSPLHSRNPAQSSFSSAPSSPAPRPSAIPDNPQPAFRRARFVARSHPYSSPSATKSPAQSPLLPRPQISSRSTTPASLHCRDTDCATPKSPPPPRIPRSSQSTPLPAWSALPPTPRMSTSPSARAPAIPQCAAPIHACLAQAAPALDAPPPPLRDPSNNVPTPAQSSPASRHPADIRLERLEFHPSQIVVCSMQESLSN